MIKSTGSSQGCIQRVRPISRADYDNGLIVGLLPRHVWVPTVRTNVRESNENLPSMQVRNWATIRRSISLCALSLLGVIASISSMNRRQGAAFCKQKFRREIRFGQVVATRPCFVKGIAESLLRLPRHSRDDRGRGDADERDAEFLAVSSLCPQDWIGEGSNPPLQ